MKRYKVILSLFLVMAIFCLMGALYYQAAIAPPTPPTSFGAEVTAFDEYMTELGYERMPSAYECYTSDYYAFYLGYAYAVGDTFAYARESGDGHIHMYLPPELEPAEYFHSLYPDLDFVMGRGGKDADGREVYWNEEADMCLSISPAEDAALDAPKRPVTLSFAIYRNKDYSVAIRNVWSHKDDGAFRYYFTYNGKMSMFGDLNHHGDLWISVSDTEDLISKWSVTIQQ